MPSSSRGQLHRRESYAEQAHRPWYGLVFVLPLLVIFHAGTAYLGYPSRSRAHRDIRWLFDFFGVAGEHIPGLAVVGALGAQHLLRRDRWDLSGRVLAGMLGESLLWALPLVMLDALVARAFALSAETASRFAASNGPMLLFYVGAAIFEEFLFRLVLISLALLFFVDLLGLKKEIISGGAVVLGAVIFGFYHFSAAHRAFQWAEFAFLAGAGVYLGVIYVFRGFAVAVGAHVCFNLYYFYTACARAA